VLTDKPRIVGRAGAWSCHGHMFSQYAVGQGSSPLAAYHDWLDRAAQQLTRVTRLRSRPEDAPIVAQWLNG